MDSPDAKYKNHPSIVKSIDPLAQYPLLFTFKDKKTERSYVEYAYGKLQLRMKIFCVISVAVLMLLLVVDVYNMYMSLYHPLAMKIFFPCIRIAEIALMFILGVVLVILHKRFILIEFIWVSVMTIIIALLQIHSITDTTSRADGFPAGGICAIYVVYIIRPRIKRLYLFAFIVVFVRVVTSAIYYGFKFDHYTSSSSESVEIRKIIVHECVVAVFNLIGLFQAMILEIYTRSDFRMTQLLKKKQEYLDNEIKKTDRLLNNILPGHLVESVKIKDTRVIQHYDNLVALYSDIVGFTRYCSKAQPSEIVRMLNGMFSRFDIFACRYQVEKVKTIGDAFFGVSGLIEIEKYDPCKKCISMAIEMIDTVKSISSTHGKQIDIRIGIARADASVIIMGLDKVTFDVIGSAPNEAEKLESTSENNRIHVSYDVYDKCKDNFTFDELDDGTHLVINHIHYIHGASTNDVNNSTDQFETESVMSKARSNVTFDLDTNVIIDGKCVQSERSVRKIHPPLKRYRSIGLFQWGMNSTFLMDVVSRAHHVSTMKMFVDFILAIGFIGVFCILYQQYLSHPVFYVMIGFVFIHVPIIILYLISVIFRWSSLQVIFVMIQFILCFVNPYLIFSFDYKEVVQKSMTLTFLYLLITINTSPLVILPIKILSSVFVFLSGVMITTVLGSIYFAGFNAEYFSICILIASLSLILFASYHLHLNISDHFLKRMKVKRIIDDTLCDVTNNEILIQSSLPLHIARRISNTTRSYVDYGKTIVAKYIHSGCVLFVKVTGFHKLYETNYSKSINVLNDLFASFDVLAERHSCYKIKSIGNMYLMVSGLEDEFTHVQNMINCVFDMKNVAHEVFDRHAISGELHLKMGLHNGPFVSGVVGQKKYLFDVFGHSVNVASRLCSTVDDDNVQCLDSITPTIEKHCLILVRDETVFLKGIGEEKTVLIQKKNKTE
jgi:class 3 adenylate cyclase